MNELTRKNFIKKSVLGICGLGITGSLKGENIVEQQIIDIEGGIMEKRIYNNVRLETGFEYNGDVVVSTKTELFQIEVTDGKISKIMENNSVSGGFDAQGYLMLPAFKDMHIHLDKTFYGDHWQARRARAGGVKAMIALEQEILPEMLLHSIEKAGKLIELLQSKGSSFARSHVNIEPTSKLDSLNNLKQALNLKKDSFSAELVAFPQHGLYYTDTVPYMKDAAQAGIDFIGGLDPMSIDGGIEKPIDFTVQLALDNQKGIDIHLHETGASGVQTIEYLIKKVLENPALKGKTFLSHCFALGRMPQAEQEAIAEKLAEAQIGIVSTVPFAGLIMPIPTLLNKGVSVMTGNDSIVDHWDVFGTGSVLQKANLAAQLYNWSTEFKLSRALKLANVDKLPLDDKGVQKWPKVGDRADFVLMDVSCSAEAVARIPEVKHLITKGDLVY